MFWGYRSARYYIVAFWSRIAASGVSFSGFVRPLGPLGNKAAKTENPEKHIFFWFQFWHFFRNFLDISLFCFVFV